MLSTIFFSPSPPEAKVIAPSAEKGENKIFIRADGLACYFCAYGMERFFKQSGRIAWYDMKMTEGIVEIGFIRGKPILDIQTLRKYVYDAGFSPREIKAEFVGRFNQLNEGYTFQITETEQIFPVEENAIIQQAIDMIDREVVLKAGTKDARDAPFKLVPESIDPKGFSP
jgi:hypothetical protein